MDLAKISANGQITVPVEIRRQPGLKSGDKDFLSLDVEHPKCMTVAQFLESEGIED